MCPHNNERLDIIVAQRLDISRHQAQQHIKNGSVLVNKKIGKASQKIIDTDTLTIGTRSKESNTLTPVSMHLNMLYEDAYIIVLNKPAGLIVHPVHSHQDPTLVHGLLHYTKDLSNLGGNFRPGIVHRLDKDTEGLMVIAKTNVSHETLKQQFADRSTEKHYYAMVKNDVRDESGKIHTYLARHPKYRRIRSVVSKEAENAKEAETSYVVLQHFGSKTLLDVSPKTGRTHQIRVHMHHIGHPIIGDPDYGSERKKGKGQLLQAYKLSFNHPQTGLRLTFELPLSKRLQKK